MRGRRGKASLSDQQVAIDGYIVDFLCRQQRLIIEVDGGLHTPEEAKRTAHLESQGFRVIRFWNNDVLQNLDGIWTMIEEALETTPPHPTR